MFQELNIKKYGSDFEDKIDKIEKKIPDVSNLVKKKTDFNTKITKVEGKIPNISGLSTSSELSSVKNKIPDIISLATSSALAALENKIPDITGLVTKADFDVKLKTISDRVTKNKSKHLLVENELKKLKAPDLSYFLGKSYFDADDGTQNLLVFQPARKCFKTFKNTAPIVFSPSDFIIEWKSKGLKDVIKCPDNSFAPALFTSTRPYPEFKRVYPKLNGSCLKQDKITFNHGFMVNIYIVYDLESNLNNIDPTIRNCLFGAVKLTKNNDIDKYKYSGYGIEFDSGGTFLFPDGSFGENLIFSLADMSSSVHANHKINNILVLGKGFIQGINDTTIYAEKTYSINFTKTKRKFCLSLHYNGDNSYLFVNGKEICKFKAKDSEIAPYPVCLGIISKDFSVDSMKKTGL